MDRSVICGTRDDGIVYEPGCSKGQEVFVDADFAGAYDHSDTENLDTAKSRHGYIITYAGMPIVWKSQLQTSVEHCRSGVYWPFLRLT